MRDMILGLLAVSGVGAGVYYWPAGGADVNPQSPSGNAPSDVYPLSPAEAVSRLSQAQTRTGTAPFFNTEMRKEFAGTSRVDFKNAEGQTLCQAFILPSDGGVKVTPTCKSAARSLGTSDVAGRTGTALMEDGFAEFVDSALDGRTFNKVGTTAQTVQTMNDNLDEMIEESHEMQRELENPGSGY